MSCVQSTAIPSESGSEGVMIVPLPHPEVVRFQ